MRLVSLAVVGLCCALGTRAEAQTHHALGRVWQSYDSLNEMVHSINALATHQRAHPNDEVASVLVATGSVDALILAVWRADDTAREELAAALGVESAALPSALAGRLRALSRGRFRDVAVDATRAMELLAVCESPNGTCLGSPAPGSGFRTAVTTLLVASRALGREPGTWARFGEACGETCPAEWRAFDVSTQRALTAARTTLTARALVASTTGDDPLLSAIAPELALVDSRLGAARWNSAWSTSAGPYVARLEIAANRIVTTIAPAFEARDGEVRAVNRCSTAVPPVAAPRGLALAPIPELSRVLRLLEGCVDRSGIALSVDEAAPSLLLGRVVMSLARVGVERALLVRDGATARIALTESTTAPGTSVEVRASGYVVSNGATVTTFDRTTSPSGTTHDAASMAAGIGAEVRSIRLEYRAFVDAAPVVRAAFALGEREITLIAR